jgi:hypothetical protein
MSFNFTLASLRESARDRLSRLESQRGARLLSPTASLATGSPVARGTTSGAFPSFPSLGRSGELLTSGELGVSGESFLPSGSSGGGASALSLFEMTPDLQGMLCQGTVSNGVKFCTLGADQCNFGSHSKKIQTEVGSLYISSCRNSAFSHHFIPTSLLSPLSCARSSKSSIPRRNGPTCSILGNSRWVLPLPNRVTLCLVGWYLQ